MTDADRSDPGVRAAAAFEHTHASERRRRIVGTLSLGAVALVAPFAAEPLTGDHGATVGAVVGSLVLLALAVAASPHEWSPEEERHHRLEAIWREVRTDADVRTPWERYAAWVEPADGAVELVVIRRAPVAERAGGSLSPFSPRVHLRLGPDDVASAAEAMEKLRGEAAGLEEKARQLYEESQVEAERSTHEETLRSVDEAAESYQREQDERLRREGAEQDAAERQAQAEALVRALRRP